MENQLQVAEKEEKPEEKKNEEKSSPEDDKPGKSYDFDVLMNEFDIAGNNYGDDIQAEQRVDVPSTQVIDVEASSSEKAKPQQPSLAEANPNLGSVTKKAKAEGLNQEPKEVPRKSDAGGAKASANRAPGKPNKKQAKLAQKKKASGSEDDSFVISDQESDSGAPKPSKQSKPAPTKPKLQKTKSKKKRGERNSEEQEELGEESGEEDSFMKELGNKEEIIKESRTRNANRNNRKVYVEEEDSEEEAGLQQSKRPGAKKANKDGEDSDENYF